MARRIILSLALISIFASNSMQGMEFDGIPKSEIIRSLGAHVPIYNIHLLWSKKNNLFYKICLIRAKSELERNPSALHDACKKGDLEKVALLIASGADVHATNKEGRTPLHCAAKASQAAVAKLLIQEGADVHVMCFTFTPLHFAAHNGDAELSKLLIDRGAAVNAADNYAGYTPLHIAAQYSKARCAKLLIDSSADVHATDKDGSTPLHKAVAADNQTCVIYLLARLYLPQAFVMPTVCYKYKINQPRKLKSLALEKVLDIYNENSQDLPKEALQLLKAHPIKPWDLKSLALVKFLNTIEDDITVDIMQLVKDYPSLLAGYKKILPFINLNNKLMRRLFVLSDKGKDLGEFCNQACVEQLKTFISMQNNQGQTPIDLAKMLNRNDSLRALESVIRADNFDQLPEEIKQSAVCQI